MRVSRTQADAIVNQISEQVYDCKVIRAVAPHGSPFRTVKKTLDMARSRQSLWQRLRSAAVNRNSPEFWIRCLLVQIVEIIVLDSSISTASSGNITLARSYLWVAVLLNMSTMVPLFFIVNFTKIIRRLGQSKIDSRSAAEHFIGGLHHLRALFLILELIGDYFQFLGSAELLDTHEKLDLESMGFQIFVSCKVPVKCLLTRHVL